MSTLRTEIMAEGRRSTGLYEELFATLRARGDGAFIPFFMLGDPSPEHSLQLIEAAIEAGADALELGIGFSDPVADGPAIVRSHVRAMAATAAPGEEVGPVLAPALEVIRAIRAAHPRLPIGMLLYANMVLAGRGAEALTALAAAGVDSVLVADCPTREAKDLLEHTRRLGISAVFIAPPQARAETLGEIAALSGGYVYAVSRPGVTGTHQAPDNSHLARTLQILRAAGSAPVVQGFGIRSAADVRAALEIGVDGVICGSALTEIIEAYLRPEGFDAPGARRAVAAKVADLKAATIGALSPALTGADAGAGAGADAGAAGAVPTDSATGA